MKNGITLWDHGENIERSSNDPLAWSLLMCWQWQGNTPWSSHLLCSYSQSPIYTIGIFHPEGVIFNKMQDFFVWRHKPFQPFTHYHKEMFVVKDHLRSKSGRMDCLTPTIITKFIRGIIYKQNIIILLSNMCSFMCTPEHNHGMPQLVHIQTKIWLRSKSLYQNVNLHIALI